MKIFNAHIFSIFLIILPFIFYQGHSQSIITNENLVNASFDVNGKLIITPSQTSSQHDFDFFEGNWHLRNRLLKILPDSTKVWNEFDATQEMHTILNGIGNVDNFIAIRDEKPFEGMTLRLYDPNTKLWSLYWADSRYGILYLPPVVGSFENKVGHFYSQDEIEGKKVTTVYRWDARDPDHPVWSQATSENQGKTWDWNWFMSFSRKPEH